MTTVPTECMGRVLFSERHCQLPSYASRSVVGTVSAASQDGALWETV